MGRRVGKVPEHGHAPGEVAEERPVGGDASGGTGADERGVHDPEPARHRTRGRGSVTPLLGTDAGVFREGPGERETQRTPLPQPVHGRQRRRHCAAGAKLAGAGTTYFLVVFLAAF